MKVAETPMFMNAARVMTILCTLNKIPFLAVTNRLQDAASPAFMNPALNFNADNQPVYGKDKE